MYYLSGSLIEIPESILSVTWVIARYNILYTHRYRADVSRPMKNFWEGVTVLDTS